MLKFPKMPRKTFLKISLAAALVAFLGLVFLIFLPKPAKTIENQPEQNQTAPRLESFRGVLADILKDAEEKAVEIKNEIAEAIPNPFTVEKKEAAEENKFTFAVLGDTQYFTAGNPRGNFQKAVAGISKENPDLVVAVGDLVSNCKGKSDDARDYANWKNVLGPLASKTYAVQGNHDRVENEDKCDRFWTDAFAFPINGPEGFAEFTYSLDFENSHFVFLDSNKPDAHEINETQRDWLEKDLAANKKENTFVFFHEPAYPVSDKATESLDVEPSQRNALWSIFKKHNVTAVFNGHEHLASRRKVDGIYQFVFGSTDSFDHNLPAAGVAEFANLGQGRFGIVRVAGKEITVETRNPDGKILDTFTFSK
jgi:predicted phosphodiesterase